MTGKTILYLTICIAAVSLSIGYVLAGISLGVVVILLNAAFWLLGEWRGWRWAASVNLILFVLLTIAGLLFGTSPIFGIITAVAALVGWDYSHFTRYLAQVENVEKQTIIEKQHQQRILVVAGGGVVVSAVAATLRLNFGFGLALLLGLIAIIGFSRALSFLRRESD